MSAKNDVYVDEELRKHLKNPDFSTKSLEQWSLNGYCRSMLAKFLIGIDFNPMKNSVTHDYLDYPEWLLGDHHYLEGVAKFLSNFYRHPADSSTLAATYGATHGYSLIMTEFYERGDYIFVEDLTFWGVSRASKDYGMICVPVSCDNDGINIVELETKLQEHQKMHSRILTSSKPFWAIIYLMAQLHNPKGTSYTEARCKEVVAMARKYNVLVISDDVYFPYRYTKADANMVGDVLVGYDKCNWEDGTGHVVSNGSFSKLLFPSLRLGWIDTSPWILNKIEARADIYSCGGFNAYNQQMAAAIINNPNFMSLFESLKEFYAVQMKIACDYLEKNMTKEVIFNKPEGSFFIWLKLPQGCDSADLLNLCEKYHVKFMLGKCYSAAEDGKSYHNYFRLAVTNLPKKELIMSLHVICKQTKLYLQKLKI